MRGVAPLLALAVWTAPAVQAAGVVGNGTPASCTEAAFSAALAGVARSRSTAAAARSSSRHLDQGALREHDDRRDGPAGHSRRLGDDQDVPHHLPARHRAEPRLPAAHPRNGRAAERGAALELVWQEPSRLTQPPRRGRHVPGQRGGDEPLRLGRRRDLRRDGRPDHPPLDLRRKPRGNGGALGSIAVRITSRTAGFEGERHPARGRATPSAAARGATAGRSTSTAPASAP